MTESVALFWSISAVLIAAAVGFLLIPAWGRKRKGGQWSHVGLGSAIAIAPVATFLYFQISTWDEAEAVRASEAVQLVERLAARMRENPEDVRGWRLLGNSYMTMGLYTQARAAFAEAWQRTPLPDNSLKVELAEAQVFAERQGLTPQAVRLFEEVLVSEPSNQKALWYAALAAEQIGNEYVTRRHLSNLLEQSLPTEIRRTVERKFAALPTDPSPDARAPGVVLTAQVDIAPEFASYDIGSQALLFLIARDSNDTPPIAVVRHPANVIPGELTLSDADSIAGRSLGDFETFRLIARISRSGQATAEKGDLQGEILVSPRRENRVALVIDEVIE